MASKEMKDIETLFRIDGSQLFERLVRDLEEHAVARFPPGPSPEDLRRIARRLLRRIKDSLRDKVCTNNKFMDLWRSERTYDRVILAAAIADLVASLGFGVAPAVVGVLIVKEGVESLCT